jgi:L-malate glycosyltransferase
MRVVQLVMSKQYRGAEIFAAHLSRELVLQGAEVLYVSLFKNPNTTIFEPEGVVENDLGFTKSGGIHFGLIKKLAEVLKEFNPDIVQANAGDTLKYAVIVKLIFRLKYKTVFRNASTVSQYFKSPFQKMVYASIYRFVDRVVSVCQFSKDDFVNVFPFMKTKIEVIPNCVAKTNYKKLQDFHSSHFNIVHVAGFTFEKNHEGMLRIFQMFKAQEPRAKLWLVGDGPLRSSIEKRVSELRLADVEFLGGVTNPMDYIATADVLVLPSVIEGLPAVILESFYCQTPVVAYNVGGIGEVLKTDSTGWLVEANDEKGFVLALLTIKDSSNLSQIKANAHDRVIKEFNCSAIGEKFFLAYQEMVG